MDITNTEIDTLLEKEFASWFNTYVSNGIMPLKNYSFIYIYIVVFVDDILIYSQSEWEHEYHFRIVL